MTTQKEIDGAFISTLESIIGICDKTTSSNVSHNIATIKGKCNAMLQFYKEFPVNSWHSVADGDLPKKPKGDCNHLPFLVIARNNEIIPTFYKGGYSFIDGEWDCEVNVKYWMEIPAIPEKEK